MTERIANIIFDGRIDIICIPYSCTRRLMRLLARIAGTGELPDVDRKYLRQNSRMGRSIVRAFTLLYRSGTAFLICARDCTGYRTSNFPNI
jgi:hypothetical protein